MTSRRVISIGAILCSTPAALALLALSAPGCRDASIGTVIGSGDNQVAVPQVAVDGMGNATVVWMQEDTDWDIWANRFEVASGWGNPTRLEADDDLSAEYPNVAMDDAGNAIAVWYRSSSVWAARYEATGWGEARRLDTEAGAQKIAMDHAGNALAVWNATGGISAARFDVELGWGTPSILSDGTEAHAPQVAFDGAGNAIVVWWQWDPINANIWSRDYSAAEGWGEPAPVETSDDQSTDPAIAVDDAGNVALVWCESVATERSTVAALRRVGEEWSTAEPVETEPGGGCDARVALDSSGNAFATWAQIDVTYTSIWANRYEPDRGWGTATLLEHSDEPLGDAGQPSVAVDGDGEAVVAWAQDDGLDQVVWASRSTDAGWTSPVPLSSSEVGRAYQPDLAARAHDVIVVWGQEAGEQSDVRASFF